MNEVEAMKIMKYNKHLLGLPDQGEWWKENSNTIACDLAISALEKQIPKKPQEVDVDFSTFVCPNCLSTIMYTDEKETHNYCLKCGQRLDWRVEE